MTGRDRTMTMVTVTKINGWRVTTTDGSVIPVNVRTQDDVYWAGFRGCVGACEPSPLLAVARAASAAMLDVAEILAPGVATRDEVERLRAIIEGRTTPPTDAEIAALVAGGGWWRCAEDGSLGMAMCVDYDDVIIVLRDAATEGVTLRWWAHDRTSRPCAWPTVTP